MQQQVLLRTCDLDAPSGPYEISEEEWDGVSVWIGNIPSHAVERVTGQSGGMAVAWGAGNKSAKRYRLSEDLSTALNLLGEGVG